MTRRKCQCLRFGVKDGGRSTPNDLTSARDPVQPTWKIYTGLWDRNRLFKEKGVKQKCERSLKEGTCMGLSLRLLALGLHWELTPFVHKETDSIEVQHDGDQNPGIVEGRCSLAVLLCLLGGKSPPFSCPCAVFLSSLCYVNCVRFQLLGLWGLWKCGPNIGRIKTSKGVSANAVS